MAYGKYSILFSETVWNALKKFWIILFNTARKIAGNLNHYMHNLLQISFHTKNKFHTLLCKEKKATNCDTFKWRAYHKQKHCSKSNSWHTDTSFALRKHSLNWCFFWNRVKLFKDSLNRNWLLAIQYKTF